MQFALSELRKLGEKRIHLLDIKHALSLHAMANFCSYENISQGDDYSWNKQKRFNVDFFLWQYTLSGLGTLNYKNKDYKLKPGTAMLLRISQKHYYCLPEDSPGWEFISLYFHGNELMRLFSKLQQRTGPVLNHDEDSPCVAIALNICLLAAKNKLLSQFDNSNMAYSFAMNLMKEEMSPRQNDPEKPSFVQKIEEYCKRNMSQTIGVDDLATISGYSRHHFSRIFTAYQHESPAQFLRNMRLREAAKLLQHTRFTIREIASRCGFMDCSHFCRLFRQTYGFPPETYRLSINR